MCRNNDKPHFMNIQDIRGLWALKMASLGVIGSQEWNYAPRSNNLSCWNTHKLHTQKLGFVKADRQHCFRRVFTSSFAFFDHSPSISASSIVFEGCLLLTLDAWERSVCTWGINYHSSTVLRDQAWRTQPWFSHTPTERLTSTTWLFQARICSTESNALLGCYFLGFFWTNDIQIQQLFLSHAVVTITCNPRRS